MEKRMSKILVVEDDIEINKMLQSLLKKNQYEVISAFSGTEALLLLEKTSFDLVLLDLMLPGLSGEELILKINKQMQVPVICVSAKDDLDTKLEVIRDGADDYITKPFNNEELIVRISAVLRRCNKATRIEKNNMLRFKDLVMDSENHTVFINNESIDLTVKEFSILELLISNPKKVFTKQNIFESVWSEEYIVDERAVTVHVSNLRNKLKHGEAYIKTVWGIGYKMQDDN
jgi:DNA-binding response OmpR family regulator